MKKFKELFSKWIRNQRLIPVIDINQGRLLSETRRWQMESELIQSRESGISHENVFEDKRLIVSLTSYGRRLYDVPYTIQSIMRQTQKPNRIILWIDSNDEENIPIMLKKLQSRGLEIRVTPEEIRSHKKLYHSLVEFPDDVIVTMDDDVIYEYDLLERLASAYRTHPNSICACRVHRVTFEKDGKILPYKSWQWNYKKSDESYLNFLTGVGGVLYPPHSLAVEVLDIDKFKELCPLADDVWYYCMALKKHTPIYKIPTRQPSGTDYVENFAFHDEGLMQVNTKGECLNDRQLKATMNHYKLWPVIAKEQQP